MATKKKAAKFTVNEQGYRVIGTPPVEQAKKALTRKAIIAEIRDTLLMGGLPYAKRQRVNELLDQLEGCDE